MRDANELLESVIDDVRGAVPEPAIEAALKNATIRVDKGKAVLVFPEQYMVRMITKQVSDTLTEAISLRVGEPVQLTFEIDKGMRRREPLSGADSILGHIRVARETLTGRSWRPLEQPSDTVPRLNPDYTFEKFVVGSHNRLAHAGAVAVAKSPGTVYNPLFIYSNTGLGKTHLLQAIGHETMKLHPGIKVCYATAEKFTNQLIEGIRDRDKMEQFTRTYRSTDVLLIDDIHFLIGKEQTQEAFFHTFNALHELRRQIVISSDRPPAHFDTLEDRLRTRFAWGLIADISKPDFETRLAILRVKNEDANCGLSDEILACIASRLDGSIRELQGGLTRVSAHQKLSTVPLTVEEVEAILADCSLARRTGQVLSPRDIMQEVAGHFGVTIEELRGNRRTARITVPRQVAMYLCRELTMLSLKDIGAAFGGKDHTTVIYALEKVEERLGVEEELAREVALLRSRLKERFKNASG